MAEEFDIKAEVTQLVHDIANEVDWQHLTIPQRKQYYEDWTLDSRIGGRLRMVMQPSQVRVYLKDTVMKAYSRAQRPQLPYLLESMDIDCDRVQQEFIKPVAILCNDGNLYTIAAAKEWKTAIMSAFERGATVKYLQRNVVFIIDHTTGRFVDKSYRAIIDEAARRLNVEVHWVT